MIELGGDLERPAFLRLEKEVDGQLGVAHPAGGVDARADPEPDVAFGHPLPGQAADVEQAFQIRACAFRSSSMSPCLTMIRFSPRSAATSEIVPMATSFRVMAEKSSSRP